MQWAGVAPFERLNGADTASEAIASLCEGMEPDMASEAERAAWQALELLYVDGAITA